MSLTSKDAIDRIAANPNAYTTADSLRALAAQVDVSANGNVTVLYSGKIGSDINSGQVITISLYTSRQALHARL